MDSQFRRRDSMLHNHSVLLHRRGSDSQSSLVPHILPLLDHTDYPHTAGSHFETCYQFDCDGIFIYEATRMCVVESEDLTGASVLRLCPDDNSATSRRRQQREVVRGHKVACSGQSEAAETAN